MANFQLFSNMELTPTPTSKENLSVIWFWTYRNYFWWKSLGCGWIPTLAHTGWYPHCPVRCVAGPLWVHVLSCTGLSGPHRPSPISHQHKRLTHLHPLDKKGLWPNASLFYVVGTHNHDFHCYCLDSNFTATTAYLKCSNCWNLVLVLTRPENLLLFSILQVSIQCQRHKTEGSQRTPCFCLNIY